MESFDQRPYFFDAGIRFACRRCGACCAGDPGVVVVNGREVADIAAYLGMSVSAVSETYILPWEKEQRIRETDDGRCLFFEDDCRIYPVRPNQCKTFPFWFSNLRSESRWIHIHSQCSGVGSGRLYTKTDILDILKSSM